MKSNTKVNATSSRKERMLKLVYHEVAIVVTVVVLLSILVGGIAYYQINSGRVYIEKSEVNAPIISLKSESAGVLEELLVKEGDYVPVNTVVARVGNNVVRTLDSGIITFVKNAPGQFVTNQDTLVQMYNPQELKVIGHIDEDKGLKDIKPGQRVVFTLDAYNSKEYEGTVESVSSTAHEGDVVFSISDKREIKKFDIKVDFNIGQYPEIKNGMSARMWVYK